MQLTDDGPDPLSHVDELEALPWPRPGRWKVRGRDLVYTLRARGVRLEVTPRGERCRVRLTCDLRDLARLVAALVDRERARPVARRAPAAPRGPTPARPPRAPAWATAGADHAPGGW